MKVKVLKTDEYAVYNMIYKDVEIEAGTEFFTTELENIGSHIRYFVQHKGKTVVLYDDDVILYPDEVTDQISAMRIAKVESLNKQKDSLKQLPNLNDTVLYTVSTITGTITGSYEGVVVDMTIRTAYHVLYKVRDNISGEIHEVVVGHPRDFYSGDSIVKKPGVGPHNTTFQYYAIHDQREDKIRLDSIHVHREYTENYLRSLMGEPAPSYMKVRKIKVQFDD